jgi:hypothetical protein
MHVTIDSKFISPEPLVGLPNEPDEFDFQVRLVNAVHLIFDLLPLSREFLIEFKNFKSSLCHQDSVIVFCTLSEPVILCSLNMIALKYSKSLPDDVDFIYFISNLAHFFLLDPYISVHLDACNTLSQESFI